MFHEYPYSIFSNELLRSQMQNAIAQLNFQKSNKFYKTGTLFQTEDFIYKTGRTIKQCLSKYFV